ncbi:MAG TPA: type II secretion system F family protein [Acetobacteraceae bacterium]
MPAFRYIASASPASTIEGRMEAPTRAAVVDRLHALGQVPIRVEEIGTTTLSRLLSVDLFGARRISSRSLALLTSQFGTLLRAGLEIDSALTVLQELVENNQAREVLRAVTDKVRGGASLADAMAAQKDVFAPYYVSMIRAGEAGASLDAVLERLAEFLARSQATRDHIKSAMVYPILVALTCCLSIATLVLFVVPRFKPLFEQSGDALPLSARYLLNASDFLRAWWFVLLLAPFLIGFVIRLQLRNPSRRAWRDRWVLKLPLFGTLVRDIEVARFSRTLGILLKNGVSLLSSLTITRETIRNTVFVDAINAVIDRAKAGKGLAEPIRQTKVFPALAVHLVRVGEESGRQEDMLLKIADLLEAETRSRIDRLLTLLTPAVTIVLGVVVAGIIMSILTALLSVYNLTM